MFKFAYHVKKAVYTMTYQGKHYSAQREFFKELWKQMRGQFSEENHTSSATFVLERFLEALPLEYINKKAFYNTIDEAYERVQKKAGG